MARVQAPSQHRQGLPASQRRCHLEQAQGPCLPAWQPWPPPGRLPLQQALAGPPLPAPAQQAWLPVWGLGLQWVAAWAARLPLQLWPPRMQGRLAAALRLQP